MGNTRQDYIDKYAAIACEQMKRYGIPASVILAQGIVESANGQSELSRLHNNHFGVKATAKWLEEGGGYAVYTDDRPNEKFCKYATVDDSFEHHSRFLVENSRYAALFKLNPDDYIGWTSGLQQAGYASGKNYAQTLQSIIKANGLEKYDQQVLAEMQSKQSGVEVGQTSPESTRNRSEVSLTSHYSFPIKSKEFLLITSPFGMRSDPMDPSRQQMHKGIDILADHVPLLATEENGKVVAVNQDTAAVGGKSVTIEYARDNGEKMRVFCCHLENISVRVGEEVKAGQQLGITGNTGQRTTGPHLHLGVKQVSSDGTARDIDPASYLAVIAVKGSIQQGLMYNGENLISKYVTAEERETQLGQPLSSGADTIMSPENWMTKLLSSEDAGGVSLAGGNSLLDMIVNIFSTLMAMALSIDNESIEHQMQQVTDSALSRQINLSGIVRGVSDCILSWPSGKSPQFSMTVGEQKFTHELSDAETRNLSVILQDQTRSETEKQQRLNSFVGQIVIQKQLSNNYEQTMGQGESQGMQR